MITVLIITALVFIALGFLMRKYPDLIAGYNTMSEDRKKNVDRKGLGRFMFIWCICIAVSLIAAMVVFYLLDAMYLVDMAVCVIFGIGIIVAAVCTGRYDHNPKSFRKMIPAIVVLIIIGGAAAFIIYSSVPSKITANDNKVSFSGLYETEIPVAGIKEATISEDIPAIKMRTNGFAFSKVKKGLFRLDSLGSCRLYLHNNTGPYLIISMNDGNTVIANYKDPAQVKEIHSRIVSAMTRGYIVKVGDMVPQFELELLDGTKIDISDLRGKVVMLQFTASWCSVCRKEMPHIESDIWLKLKDNENFALYGIDLKESPEKITEFASQIPVTYPITLDPDGKLFELFCNPKAGVTRNIIIDRNGKIIKLTRLYDEAEFASMVELIQREIR